MCVFLVTLRGSIAAAARSEAGSVLCSCAPVRRSPVMTNAYRLPRTVVPSHYSLTLEPDLTAGAFEGTVDIVATVETATSVVSLNALDLDVRGAWLDVAGERIEVRVEIDAA